MRKAVITKGPPFFLPTFRHTLRIQEATSCILPRSGSVLPRHECSNEYYNHHLPIRRFSSHAIDSRPVRSNVVDSGSKLHYDDWTQRSVTLVETVPVGSMTLKEWRDAVRAMTFWTGLCTPLGVSWAWRILDRLVDEKKQQLLQQQQQTNEDANHHHHDDPEQFRLAHKWLNDIVNSWRHCPPQDIDQIMDPYQIADKINDYDPHILPTINTYRMLVSTLASQMFPKEIPLLGDTLLKTLWEQAKARPGLSPNEGFYNALLNAWASSGHPDAPQRCEALVKEMQSYCFDHGIWALAPNNVSYTAIIKAWANSGDASQAEAWLQQMTDISSASSSATVYPDTASYLAVLQAWAKSDAPDAASRSEAILDQMERLYYEQGMLDVKPNEDCYAATMEAYAKSGQPQNAKAVFQRMRTRHQATNDPDTCPTIMGMSTLLDAWANSEEPNAAHMAEAVLYRCMNRAMATGNRDMCPDFESFMIVLRAWKKRSFEMENAAERAEKVLDQMQDLFQNGLTNLQPKTSSFNEVLQCWCNSRHPQAAGNADALLRRMHKFYKRTRDEGVKPDIVSYQSVISAYAKSGHPKSPERAEALLQQMHQLYDAGDKDMKPNVIIYNTVMKTWARITRPEAPERAEALLQRMQQLYDEGDKDMKPTIRSYDIVLHTWVKSNNVNAAERAHDLMHRLCEGEMTDAKPNLLQFNMVLTCLANSILPGAAKRAEDLLQQMQKLYNAGNTEGKPDLITCNAVLKACNAALKVSTPKSSTLEALEQAETLLERMCQGNLDGVEPNKFSFHYVLSCIVNSRQPDAPKRAQVLLQRMLQLSNEGRDQLKPDTATCTIVLDAWSKSGHPNAPEQAEEFLQRMQDGEFPDIEPSVWSYSAVLNCWAKSTRGDGPKRAEALLHRMQELHAAGYENAKPNVVSINSVLNAWSRSTDPEAPERADALLQQLCQGAWADVQPELNSFNTVLNTWVRSSRRDAANKAEAILQHMHDLYKAGHEGTKPDLISYNIVLNAWSTAADPEDSNETMAPVAPSGGNDKVSTILDAWSRNRGSTAAQRAEAILKLMLELFRAGDPLVKPNYESFNCIISAWSRSQDPNAAHHAQKYLENLKSLHKSGHVDCQPNTVSYTGVMLSWLRRKDTVGLLNAYKLLEEMNELEKSGSHHVAPERNTYQYLMGGTSHSSLEDRAERVYSLLKEMKAKSIEPGIREWNTLIFACKPIHGGTRAFQIARKALEEIHNSDNVKPNAQTYANFFQACANTDKEDRMVVTTAAYRQCCVAGFGQDPSVIKTLRWVAPSLLE